MNAHRNKTNNQKKKTKENIYIMSYARIEEGNVSNRYLLPSWFQLMNDRSQLCFSLFNRMEQNTYMLKSKQNMYIHVFPSSFRLIKTYSYLNALNNI